MNKLTPESIRALRLRLRLTQVGMAERLSGDPEGVTYHKVSPWSVYRWENGINHPSGLNAAKLIELMEEVGGKE